jgi:tetratricopeptide (TPR) repeat protein
MSNPEPLRQSLERAAAALQSRRWDEVEAICRQVVSQRGEEANALMFLGLARIERGGLTEGITLLERARRANPAHVHVLSNLGAAYRKAGRLQDARQALEAALSADAGFAVARHNLGNVLQDLGERAAAAAQYEKALELRPQYADALAALATMAEREHRLDEAQGLVERSLAAAPRNVNARLTRARLMIRNGEAAAAVTELEAMLGEPNLSGVNRAVAQGCLGDALDRLGRFDEAFAAFTAANELQRMQHPELAQDAGFMSPPTLQRLRRILRDADVGEWQHGAGLGDSAPAFLVGFPRSGTTLLEQVLASHPRVCSLEERPTLFDACEVLLAPGMGAAGWARLDRAQVTEVQKRYLVQASKFIDTADRTRLLVDKFPLSAILLPVIARIFPNARVILALRDPRDVTLSCYQQRFDMNGAMYQLLGLDTAARFYCDVMALVKESRKKLPLRFHEVRYEELTSDFDATAAAALEFLGLPWSDAVRSYAETARRRLVQTPSAAQVVRPLYTSSQGRWHNYRQHLAAVLPVLEPWVAEYGYETTS